jgi:hypothetical protein
MQDTETLSAALTAMDKGDLTNLLDISVSLLFYSEYFQFNLADPKPKF